MIPTTVSIGMRKRCNEHLVEIAKANELTNVLSTVTESLENVIANLETSMDC